MKEIRIRLAPKAHGVGKHEVAKIRLAYETVFDEFIGCGHDVRHVRDIKVAEPVSVGVDHRVMQTSPYV